MTEQPRNGVALQPPEHLALVGEERRHAFSHAECRRPAAAARCWTGSSCGSAPPARHARSAGPAAPPPPIADRVRAAGFRPRQTKRLVVELDVEREQRLAASGDRPIGAATSARYVTPPPCGLGRSESSIRSTTTSSSYASRTAETTALTSGHHGIPTVTSGRRPIGAPSGVTSSSDARRGGGSGSGFAIAAHHRAPTGRDGPPLRLRLGLRLRLVLGLRLRLRRIRTTLSRHDLPVVRQAKSLGYACHVCAGPHPALD